MDTVLIILGLMMAALLVVHVRSQRRFQKNLNKIDEITKNMDDLSQQTQRLVDIIHKKEEEKDLNFLAARLHEAPAHFERAYVRNGRPNWDTCGCNKAHFSKEEIMQRRDDLGLPKCSQFN